MLKGHTSVVQWLQYQIWLLTKLAAQALCCSSVSKVWCPQVWEQIYTVRSPEVSQPTAVASDFWNLSDLHWVGVEVWAASTCFIKERLKVGCWLLKTWNKLSTDTQHVIHTYNHLRLTYTSNLTSWVMKTAQLFFAHWHHVLFPPVRTLSCRPVLFAVCDWSEDNGRVCLSGAVYPSPCHSAKNSLNFWPFWSCYDGFD